MLSPWGNVPRVIAVTVSNGFVGAGSWGSYWDLIFFMGKDNDSSSHLLYYSSGRN